MDFSHFSQLCPPFPDASDVGENDFVMMCRTAPEMVFRYPMRRLGSAQAAYKSADESVTNSAVLQNDDHLYLPVVAGRRYIIQANLQGIGGAGSGGIKFGFSGPAATYFRGRALFTFPVSSVGVVEIAAIGNTASAFPTTYFLASYWGAYEPSASGTLQLQWAQGAADAIATTIYRGSEMSLEER